MNASRKQKEPPARITRIMEILAQDRNRTNLLRNYEQWALACMVRKVPAHISPNMLTATGLSGGVIILLSFILAANIDRHYLLLALAGFVISWLGDSLDGRLAYYRNKPRKWYGFALDITIDWISIILIGCGYIIYTEGLWELLGYGFIVMYAWEMITALIRYKITGKYSIDSGIVGPTEVRIIVSLILIAEVILPGSLGYSSIAACIILLHLNIHDTSELLKAADDLDRKSAEPVGRDDLRHQQEDRGNYSGGMGNRNQKKIRK